MSIILLFILIVGGYFYWTSLSLIVTHYETETKLNMPIRIVQISDLHNAVFGKENEDLVSLIRKQKPDVIMMTGDMLNEDDPSTEVICDLIHNLSTEYPVYFGYGNHEKKWEKTFNKDVRKIMTKSGAVVVDNDFVDIEINGNPIRIGGYMGYYRTPHMITTDEKQQKLDIQFMNDFEDTDRYKLLLNHIPTSWLDWNWIDISPVDLVLSGHYHGGVIRFFGRGLYAPYVGWFPKYTKGMFVGDKATCILSTGLGSEHIIPRLNNPPEIVLIDLK